MSSIAARNGGGPGAVAYSAAKAAVSGYTHALAKELAADGIRVNAISPGVIDTPFHGRHGTPEIMEQVAGQIELGRVGSPDECAGTILFLASPTASSFVTGEIIEVDVGHYFR